MTVLSRMDITIHTAQHGGAISILGCRSASGAEVEGGRGSAEASAGGGRPRSCTDGRLVWLLRGTERYDTEVKHARERPVAKKGVR